MEFLIFIIFIFIFLLVINKNKIFKLKEKLIIHNSECILLQKNFLITKESYININEIEFIVLKKISIISKFNKTNIDKLSISVNFFNRQLDIYQKNNSLKLLNIVKKQKSNLYDKFINTSIFILEPIKEILDKEIENINV